MDGNIKNNEEISAKTRGSGVHDIIYNPEKDFYRGIEGEYRFKAEGLFKKAKEKGISIDEISIDTVREARAVFPGIGEVELPTYIVKVKGRDIKSGQIIVDAKQIDYFNRFQKYVVEKLEKRRMGNKENKNITRQNEVLLSKESYDFELTQNDKFRIGKNLISDKEFGLEKTITGACDRVIRKLMGENDWLYPEEAKLLDEEFENVQNMIVTNTKEKNKPKDDIDKKATERQINYVKSKIRNWGMDGEDNRIIAQVLKQSGFESKKLDDLSRTEMSTVIETLNEVMPKVKKTLEQEMFVPINKENTAGNRIKQ